MKRSFISIVLTFYCLATLSAQNQNTATLIDCQPITIKFLGFKDPHGNRIKKNNLRDILECVNDKRTTNIYKTGNGMGWVGATFVSVGAILVTVAGSGNSYEYTDEQLKMGEWGLKAMGIGLGVQLGGLLLKKKAVRRYNKLVLGNLPTNGFASPASSTKASKEKHLGFAFGKTYYKRGIDLSEFFYSHGFWVEDNSEIANSGFYLSLFSETKISDRFHGRTELNWVQRGFGLSMNGTSGDYSLVSKSRVLTNYLEAAWLAQFIINTTKNNILLSAGPGLGFLSGAKIKSKVTAKENQTGESQTSSNSMKGDLEGYSFSDRLDYGLHIGAGARWPVGSNEIGFDIRYFLGLKNVTEDSYGSKKEFNRGLSLGLAYVMSF